MTSLVRAGAAAIVSFAPGGNHVADLLLSKNPRSLLITKVSSLLLVSHIEKLQEKLKNQANNPDQISKNDSCISNRDIAKAKLLLFIALRNKPKALQAMQNQIKQFGTLQFFGLENHKNSINNQTSRELVTPNNNQLSQLVKNDHDQSIEHFNDDFSPSEAREMINSVVDDLSTERQEELSSLIEGFEPEINRLEDGLLTTSFNYDELMAEISDEDYSKEDRELLAGLDRFVEVEDADLEENDEDEQEIDALEIRLRELNNYGLEDDTADIDK